MEEMALEHIEFKNDYVKHRAMLKDIYDCRPQDNFIDKVKTKILHAKENPGEAYECLCDILTMIERNENGARRDETFTEQAY